MDGSESKDEHQPKVPAGLKRLTEQQVRQIDDALASIDEYGEVRLIVQKGVLRFITRVESYRAWKSQDGE
ncbi:MAG TPA: hypothetical protein VF784_17680 [Anaerolineales bacterium]